MTPVLKSSSIYKHVRDICLSTQPITPSSAKYWTFSVGTIGMVVLINSRATKMDPGESVAVHHLTE